MSKRSKAADVEDAEIVDDGPNPADELKDAIRLALEAAEAANDAASEVSRLQSETSAAAARLDKFGNKLKPVMIGTLVGAAVSIALGGLVYFKTLAEMRRTSATQIEALAMFQDSVTQLNGQLDAVNGLSERMAKLEASGNDGVNRVIEALTGTEEKVMTQLESTTTESGGMSAQMATAITDRIDSSATTTREAIQGGISDLQLALSKMLAAAVTNAPPAAAAKPAAPAPAPKRTTSSSSKKSSSSSRKSAPKAEPNPFKFP
ncbi:MAG: hypothetical protein VX378_00100 [Pseudomonadota bacterium]|nr:hypothetical protein [Pseudomonadota bacterium]MEE3069471.1 hypothetical protein [Pseudomonadota bacterium]